MKPSLMSHCWLHMGGMAPLTAAERLLSSSNAYSALLTAWSTAHNPVLSHSFSCSFPPHRTTDPGHMLGTGRHTCEPNTSLSPDLRSSEPSGRVRSLSNNHKNKCKIAPGTNAAGKEYFTVEIFMRKCPLEWNRKPVRTGPGAGGGRVEQAEGTASESPCGKKRHRGDVRIKGGQCAWDRGQVENVGGIRNQTRQAVYLDPKCKEHQ